MEIVIHCCICGMYLSVHIAQECELDKIERIAFTITRMCYTFSFFTVIVFDMGLQLMEAKHDPNENYATVNSYLFIFYFAMESSVTIFLECRI